VDLKDNDNSIYNGNIVGAIHEAAIRSIPKTSKNLRVKNIPYWNKECKQAIVNRRRAENKMKRTKELQDCIQYRKAKAEAQLVVRHEQQHHWQEYCNSLSSDTKLASVWKMAKNMTGTKNNTNIPTLRANGVLYETATEKATLIAKTISETSSDSNYSPKFILH